LTNILDEIKEVSDQQVRMLGDRNADHEGADEKLAKATTFLTKFIKQTPVDEIDKHVDKDTKDKILMIVNLEQSKLF
jgi:hypothetical protein